MQLYCSFIGRSERLWDASNAMNSPSPGAALATATGTRSLDESRVQSTGRPTLLKTEAHAGLPPGDFAIPCERAHASRHALAGKGILSQRELGFKLFVVAHAAWGLVSAVDIRQRGLCASILFNVVVLPLDRNAAAETGAVELH